MKKLFKSAQTHLVVSTILLSAIPGYSNENSKIEGNVCLTGRCIEGDFQRSNVSAINFAQKIQEVDRSLKTPHFIQELFDIDVQLDLSTLNKGAELLNGSLGFLSKFETLNRLAKDYQVDLKKDKIETPYKRATVRTQLLAILNSEGDLIGFKIGEQKNFLMSLEKTNSQLPYVEKLSSVVLPLDLVNDKSEVSMSAEVAGLSRTLLSIQDANVNPKSGGAFRIGFIQSAALGGTHVVDLKITRDASGRFKAQQVKSSASGSFGSEGLDYSSSSSDSAVSENSRIKELRITGGVISTQLQVEQTEEATKKEVFVQGEARSQIEAGSKEMEKLLSRYKNQSTELVEGTGARMRVSVK